MIIALIIFAIFGWYSIGLLGSKLGLAVAGSNNWVFGAAMAVLGPINLLVTYMMYMQEGIHPNGSVG